MVAPFLVAAVVYVGFAVRTQSLLQGDQPHYALEAFSIADDGDRNLDDDYRDLPLVRRVWQQDTFVPQAYQYRAGGPLVSWHAPGLAILLAPAARIGGTVEAMQIELAVIAAFGAWLLFGILRRVVPGRAWLRWTVWAGVVFALPVLGYANQLYPDLPAAVLVLAVVRILVARRLTPLGMLVASACAAALPWFHVRFWPVALALALAIVLRAAGLARQRRAVLWTAGAAIALPFVVTIALTAIANDAWYGSPSPTAAQHYPIARVASSGSSPEAARRDVSSTVDVGSAFTVAPDTLYRGLGRSLFSARSGWLPFVPLALLGVAAALALAVRGNRWIAYGLLVALGYLCQLAFAQTLPGYVIPGRFEVILAPLAAIPLVMAADRVRWLRYLVVPVAVVGVVIGLAGRSHDGTLYPPAGTGKPGVNGVAWLLAPWPTVTEQQPLATPSQIVASDRMQAADGVHPQAGDLAVPQGTTGIVARTPPLRTGSGDQVAVATLARDGAADPGRTVADVALVIDGVTAVRYDVTAGELPGDGALRAIPVTARIATGQRPRIVVRSTGAVALRVGAAQVSAPQLADTGLAGTGSRYPDAARVAIWTAVMLALAALIAAGLPRRPGAYAAQPCTSAST